MPPRTVPPETSRKVMTHPMPPVNNEASAKKTTASPSPGSRTGVETPPKERQTTKITTILVPEAAKDLDHVKEETGYSKTDIVNKALILYRFISDELRGGGQLYLKRPDGETQLIRLL